MSEGSSDRRRGLEAKSRSDFSTYDDIDWKALKEEGDVASDDDEYDKDDIDAGAVHETGEGRRSAASARTRKTKQRAQPNVETEGSTQGEHGKPTKRAKKALTGGAGQPASQRQKTLYQSAAESKKTQSQMEMDQLLGKYAAIAAKADEDEEANLENVDVSRFLNDDLDEYMDDETANEGTDENGTLSASGFMASLIGSESKKRSGDTSLPAIDSMGAPPASSTASVPHAGAPKTFVSLEDEVLSYGGSGSSVKADKNDAGMTKGSNNKKHTRAFQESATKDKAAGGADGGVGDTALNYVSKHSSSNSNGASPEMIKELGFASQSDSAFSQHSSNTGLKASSVVKMEDSKNLISNSVDARFLRSLPPSGDADGLFYWIDAREIPQSESSLESAGTILLFGRMNLPYSGAKPAPGSVTPSVSCCIRVRNVERCVFILPKTGADDMAVLQEVNEICRASGIEKRHMRFVERYYAFEEEDIPRGKSRWVKLMYPAHFPPFPSKGHAPYKNISASVGANRPLLELFLTKRKIMGPAFLSLKTLQQVRQHLSHCDLEFAVNSPKHVRVFDDSAAAASRESAQNGDAPTTPSGSSHQHGHLLPPELTAASIQLHVQLNEEGTNTEVFSCAVVVYKGIHVDGKIEHMSPQEVLVGVRPFSAHQPLPLEMERVCAGKGLRGVQRCSGEHALLSWIAQTVKSVDPDMLIGHNMSAFTLETLMKRFVELHVEDWSVLGRMNLRQVPRSLSNLSSLGGGSGSSASVTAAIERDVMCGRLVVDSYTLSRDYYKSANYKLLNLASQMSIRGVVANAQDATEFEPGVTVLKPSLMADADSLFKMLSQVVNCAVLSAGVASQLDAVPLTHRLCALDGSLWKRSLGGHRSERIDFLLLHAFHNLKFVVPDRKSLGSVDAKRSRSQLDAGGADTSTADDGGATGATSKRAKAKYQGGMVLDPKSGLYSDYILLLDFNSLYPSLIQEFNICFTTVDRGHDISTPEVPPPENLICESCAAAGLPSPCKHKCVLPKVIKGLVDSRREVKKLMRTETNPKILAQLEIRQKALKLTANSMYGCLGFEFSRFYAQPLAELVTRQGRQALQNTVDLIPQIDPSLRVIYGDTDSVMIQTGIKSDIKQVRNLGLEIKSKVNKKYQSLEIDIDGIFRSMLLLKKKKYAAMTVVDWQGAGTDFKKEVKGLDMVRRDWCPLSQNTSNDVLNRVLNAESSEDVLDYLVAYMKGVADGVRRGDRYPLEDFVISKSLTKEPETYKGSSFPHATVALRMKERKETVRVGDLIPYVICEGSDKLSEKAFHVDEVRRSGTQRIDAEWYLSTQVYPPVMRICEHIQGFSATQLSEAMGLSITPTGGNAGGHGSHAHTGDRHDDDDGDEYTRRMYAQMFKSTDLGDCFPSAVPFQVQCTACRTVIPIDPHRRVAKLAADHYHRREDAQPFYLYTCTNCERPQPLPYLANCLTMMCHKLIAQFYQSGGGTTAVHVIRAQFAYFRALFDVPHLPGCPPSISQLHTFYALRCIGTDRNMYTLQQSKENPDAEAVDPLLTCADTFYKRIENMFVDVSTLFHA